MRPSCRWYIEKLVREDEDGVEVQQAMNVRLPVMEFISVVVCCDDVQEEDVLCLRVQTRDAELHLWEHLSESEVWL